MLSESDTPKSLSSGTSTEIQSSQLSVTGISSSSSNEACGVSETTPELHTPDNISHTLLSSDALPPSLDYDMRSDSGDIIRTRSTSYVPDGMCSKQTSEIDLVESEVPRKESLNATSPSAREFITSMPTDETLLYPALGSESTDVKESHEKLVKRTDSATVPDHCDGHGIAALQQALSGKINGGGFFTSDLLSLDGLSGDETNLNSYVNHLTGEGEKIKELLIRAQDIYSSNKELLQQIDRKCEVINEKDSEIMEMQRSKNEGEILLQKVKKELSKTREEAQRLQMIVTQYEEAQLNSMQLCAQCQRAFETMKQNPFNRCHENSLNMAKTSGNGNDSYPLHTQKEGETIVGISSCRNDEGVCFKTTDSFRSAGNYDKENSHVSLEVFKTTNAPDEDGPRKAVDFDRSLSFNSLASKTRYRSAPGGRTQVKEVGITGWLSNVIDQAKRQLASDESLLSPGKQSSTLPHRMLIPRCSRRAVADIASTSDDRTSSVKAKNCGVMMSSADKRCLHSTSWDGEDTIQRAVTPGRPLAIQVNPTIPFADVFLTRFEYLNLSATENYIPVLPFNDVLFPWIGPGDNEKKCRKSDASRKKGNICLANKTQAHQHGESREAVSRAKRHHCDKCIAIRGRLEETKAKRKENPSIEYKHLEEQRTGNSLINTARVTRTRGYTWDGLGRATQNDVRSSPNKVLRHSRSSSSDLNVEKYFHLKLGDSKICPTDKKAVLTSDHAFIDSVSVQISLDANKLFKYLEDKDIFGTQGSKEGDQKIKAEFTSHNKQLTCQKIETQVEPRNLHFMPMGMVGLKKDRISHCLSTGKTDLHAGFDCTFSREITKQTEDATKSCINKLMEDVCHVENRDVTASLVSHLPYTSEEESSRVNKLIDLRTTAQINSSQISSLEREGEESGEVETNLFSTYYPFIVKGQDEIYKRDIEALEKKEKNESLRDGTKDKGIQLWGDVAGDSGAMKLRKSSSSHRKIKNQNRFSCAVFDKKEDNEVILLHVFKTKMF